MSRGFFLIALFAANCCASPCFLSHTVTRGDKLPELGVLYLGSRDFASSILLATNSRTGDGFPYISDPNSLPVGKSVCIPDATEALRFHALYVTYQKAVAGMTTTEPWEVSHALVDIASGKEVTVATWKRAKQVGEYKDTAPEDTWVTVEPYLKEFCRGFSKTHGGSPDELTLRLEQRLGLPPASGNDTFLRIRLRQANPKTIFRPCADPDTSKSHCEAGPPSEKEDPKNPGYAAWFAEWFYKQYYTAYGWAHPNLYPWTALGYTFDWAQGSDGEFVRNGESEFVIPKGTAIEVLGATPTAEYCR
jgi:hypothetical protein